MGRHALRGESFTHPTEERGRRGSVGIDASDGKVGTKIIRGSSLGEGFVEYTCRIPPPHPSITDVEEKCNLHSMHSRVGARNGYLYLP